MRVVYVVCVRVPLFPEAVSTPTNGACALNPGPRGGPAGVRLVRFHL